MSHSVRIPLLSFLAAAVLFGQASAPATGGLPSGVTAISPSLGSLFVGNGAGNASVTGTEHTGLGYQAGNALTVYATGTQPAGDTVIGYQACLLCTTVGESTVIGAQAGSSYTGIGGVANGEDGLLTLIGFDAGNSLLASNGSVKDTFIGQKAAENWVEGIEDTCIGVHCGFAWNTGDANVFIGDSVGDNGTTAGMSGSNNVLVGNSIMSSMVIGLASGTYTSGISATGTTGQTCALTAFNNGTGATATVALTGTNTIAGGTVLVITAVGSAFTAAATSATAGNGTATCSGTATVATVLTGTNNYNAMFGYLAGGSQVAASYNSFFGADAGNLNTIGTHLTLVGYYAGEAGTIATDNTLIGYEAGQNFTGGFNTAIGSGASNSATTALDTVSVGYFALADMTTGANNTAVGYEAGQLVTTGAQNTFVGAQAGNKTTGSTGTFIGNQAGNSATTGSANTIIGAASGAACVGCSDVTILGRSANISGASDTNEIVIGEGVTGNGSSTATIGRIATDSLFTGGLVLNIAAPVVAAGQIGYGGTVAATGNCGSLSGDTGCIVINVAGTTRYVPYY